jgi:diguanylate cyclase (GGDEF)-like protein
MSEESKKEISKSGAQEFRLQLKEEMIAGTFKGLLLLDFDELRRVNVKEGIQAGDRALALAEEFFEEKGWKGFRTGGDEFGLVITNSDAGFSCDTLHGEIVKYITDRAGFDVRISGGGLQHPGADYGIVSEMDELMFSTAHQLLIKAKHLGRNRIVWLPQESVESTELMALAVSFYKELARVNASVAKQMEMESRIDFLTGLYNRRGFEDLFETMIQASKRHTRPIALIYMDSDSLKTINDTRGHDAGDQFIRTIASILKDVVRGSDFVSRWAGGEFAVIVEPASDEQALALGERIRSAVEKRTDGTMSIGIFCGVPDSSEAAVLAADQALYRAKENGKNRIELAKV